MVGGRVVHIVERDGYFLVQVQDRRPSDRQWRALEINKKTRCIGTGDSLWWQNKRGYWTPQGMPLDGERDIPVGRCIASDGPVPKTTVGKVTT